MTIAARLWLSLVLLMSVAAVPCGLIAQTPPPAPTVQPQQSTAESLQGLLDRDDYIAFGQTVPHADPAALTESQRLYFLGMLAFHLGRLDRVVDPLTKAVNTSDKSLTGNQIESALETLAQVYSKLERYGAAAQTYDDIDKVFGARLGDGEKQIKENRHLAVLLQHVPVQTVEISGDFTLARTGVEYPVGIAGKNFSAQLDTGAEISVLSASTAKAWGVTLLDGTAQLHGYGGGTFPAQPGLIPTLTIGKAELHNVAVYVTEDANLYIPGIKLQTNALLGYPVVAALGRLTFAKDGSLTVSAKSPTRDLHVSAALWMGDHSLLVELGTQPILSGGKVTGAAETRLFMLDTGSGSTWLTDHYLAEHTNVFHGPPPEMARLGGAGGIHEVPAYVAHPVPLFAGDSIILLNGNHILTQPQAGEAEHYFGLIGQDVLGLFSSYTIDLRNMTLTVAR